MESNSGNTLKTIAVILGVLGVIAAIVIGISVGNNSYIDGLGFGVFAGVAIASFISAVMLYGFGELIDNTVQINARMEKTEKQLDEIKTRMANGSAGQYAAPAAPSAFTAAPAAALRNVASTPAAPTAPAAPAAPAPVEKRDPAAVPAEFESMTTAKEIYLHFMKINAGKETKDTIAMEKILAELCQREANGEPCMRDNTYNHLNNFYKHGCRVFEVDRSGAIFICPVCGKSARSNRMICRECGALFRD